MEFSDFIFPVLEIVLFVSVIVLQILIFLNFRELHNFGLMLDDKIADLSSELENFIFLIEKLKSDLVGFG